MRITFIALGWEQLGISLLSSLAKRDGHEVHLAFSASLFNDRYNLSIPAIAPFFDDRKRILQDIKSQNPDVIVCSCLTGTYQWMLGMTQEIKLFNPLVKTIFGGVHVSAVPDIVLKQPQVDYVCVGEGDIAFPEILKAIEQGGIEESIVNTRYKLASGRIVQGAQSGFIQDLNSLPIFDKSIWEEHIDIGQWYLTMASRGCPYRCTFCFNNFFAELPDGKKGKYVRQRSVENMMYELRLAKRRYKLRFIEFEDDVFTVDKKWIKEFLGEYKKDINVPFQCLTHPKYIDDDVARWLKDAGCEYIQMGIQTMDDDYKFETIKRYEKSATVSLAMEIMRKHKIKPKVDHMFGLPGEPIEAQERAYELYIKYPPFRIQTFWTNFLPGTEMVKQALGLNMITEDEVDRLNQGLDFDFYRSSKKIECPEKHRAYKGYELFFKLIPVLPYFLRHRIHPRHLMKLPMSIMSLLSFVTDLCSGLILGNPDHYVYAKHNLYHIFKSLLKRVGIDMGCATKIIDDSNFNLEVVESAQSNEEKKEEVCV